MNSPLHSHPRVVSLPPIGSSSKIPSHLWAINGKLYDLRPFLKSHPGGAQQLLISQGRDCTELFESVHALSSKPIKKLLKKYQVKNSVSVRSTPFTFESSGFYEVLKSRVQNYFKTTYPNIKNPHKANSHFIIRSSIIILLWIITGFMSVQLHQPFLAFLSGIFFISIGFNIMHDGSHFGLSSKPWINHWATCFWAGFAGWNSYIWYVHHVYAHHSHTGIHGKDPDISNSRDFLRKHPDTKWKPIHSFQHKSLWPILLAFPNQFTGQGIQYWRAILKKKIFGVPLFSIPMSSIVELIPFYFLGFLFIFYFPLKFLGFQAWIWYYFLYLFGCGSTYFLTVAPNHDGLDCHQQSYTPFPIKRDWGIQQVLATTDHSTNISGFDWLITELFGSMNYQIEHHLFPTVCNVHYPAIHNLVKETAKEFGINFLDHTYLQALYQFARLAYNFSHPSQ